MRVRLEAGRCRAGPGRRDRLLRLTAVLPLHQRRAVWLLGISQCVLWGVLYYSFAVLLVPMEQAFGLSRTAVAGAFSAALLAMALAAPAVGRRLDGGGATRVLRIGTVLALSGLALVATAAHAGLFYAGWTIVGLAMALLLYEPAFALVIRAVADQEQRLRALAAVTVIGGLASTLFLPLLAGVVEHAGWRVAVLGCMAAVVASAGLLEAWVVPALPVLPVTPDATPRPAGNRVRRAWPPRLATLAVVFASGTFAGMAVVTLLVPMLIARGAEPVHAAWALATLGVAQLPGRIWLLRARSDRGRGGLHVVPVASQAVGLFVVAAAPTPGWAMGGVAVFGFGAGLQTLVRPWLVQRLLGVAESGRWNGEIARIQGFARAAAPVLAAAAASVGGAPLVIAALGGVLLVAVLLSMSLDAEPLQPAATAAGGDG